MLVNFSIITKIKSWYLAIKFSENDRYFKNLLRDFFNTVQKIIKIEIFSINFDKLFSKISKCYKSLYILS